MRQIKKEIELNFDRFYSGRNHVFTSRIDSIADFFDDMLDSELATIDQTVEALREMIDEIQKETTV